MDDRDRSYLSISHYDLARARLERDWRHEYNPDRIYGMNQYIQKRCPHCGQPLSETEYCVWHGQLCRECLSVKEFRITEVFGSLSKGSYFCPIHD